jgi:Mg-chelatase subunit ChlD
VYEVTDAGADGLVLAPIENPAASQQGRRRPGSTVITAEQSVLVAADELVEVDSRVRAAARDIAARLWIRRLRPDGRGHRGSGTLVSVPYRAGLDDIDLDRTLEVMAERPVLEDEDIIVRERVQTRRSVVLAVDVSGSMRDERVRTAAATVGALAAELPDGDLAVLAFWSDAAWLSHFGTPADPLRLLDMLVAMPGKGLTNVALPLDLATRALGSRPPKDARVVLLSDCVHNAGPDPRPAAARLPRVDVLLDEAGEKDVDLARQLARLGRGRLRRIRSHRDVAGSLSEIFAP